MAHDAVAACFERFQTEVRAEIQKKADADMASLEEENVQKQKLQDDLVQREHAATTNDYRRKIRLHKQQTEDSASKISESSDIIQAKETELLCMKTTVADLKSNIKTNKNTYAYIHIHDDDDCFYYHSWRNNVVIAFGTLSSFLT